MLWAGLSLFVGLVLHNWLRSRIKEVPALTPNCLLTRHPIVFATGKRSLFYFLNYWNQLPHWLASHGYETYNLNLPWKNSRGREKFLCQFLQEKSLQGEKIHLFIDSSTVGEISTLLNKQNFSCLSSLTLVGQRPEQENGFSRLSPFSIAIEEVPGAETERSRSLFWILHLLWTSQNFSLSPIGERLTPHRALPFLQRVQFLAERDLLQGARSPTLKA